MVQIAERASILDQEVDKITLIERANHLWDRQAIFDWEMVDISSCDSNTVSDDDSIDEGKDGSAFNSPSREDNAANYYTHIDPQIIPQLHVCAQRSFADQPAELLNPSSTRCVMCYSAINGKSGKLCKRCGRYATCKPHNVPASLDYPAPSIYSASEMENPLESSQRSAEVSLHSLVDDISYQDRQDSSCLNCGNIDMWPELPSVCPAR